MKIRTKFALMNAGLIVCVVGLLALAMARFVRSALEAQSQSRLQSLSEGVERLGREAVDARDPAMVLSYMLYLQKDHPELVFAAVSQEGHTWPVGQDGPGLLYWSRDLPAGPGSSDVLGLKLGFSRARIDADVAAALAPMLRGVALLACVFLFLGVAGTLSLAKLLTGPLVDLSAAVTAVKDGNLDAQAAAGGQDEVGALARRFNEMTARLKQLMAFREEIMQTLTHEVNTPLAGLRGYVDFWEDLNLSQDAPQRLEALRTMKAAVMRMEQSLGDALKLFRGEALEAETGHLVWLDDLCAEVAVLFSPVALSKGITLAPPPDSVECLYLDENLLRHALINLVSNALKYTPRGGTVSMDVKVEGKEARLRVSDTGYGIKPEDLPHLFTKFYRASPGTKEAQKIPGTGLGLNIAQKAIAAMGGRIEVESKVGQGSTFTIVVPKASVPAHAVPPKKEAAK